MAKSICILYDHMFPNGKHYIGQTWDTVAKRAGKTGNKYKKQPFIYRAIKKYGWENVISTVLCSTKLQENANLLEDYFIDQYDSTNPQKGYNNKRGGATGKHTEKTKKLMSEKRKGKPSNNKGKPSPLKGTKRPRDIVDKIAKANKGRIFSDVAKQNMSKGKTGKSLSEQHKQNIGIANKGQIRSEEARQNISNGKKNSITNEFRQYRSEEMMGDKNPQFGKTGEQSCNSKLTDIQRLAIQADDRPGRVIAKDYGVGPTTIYNIKNRQV